MEGLFLKRSKHHDFSQHLMFVYGDMERALKWVDIGAELYSTPCSTNLTRVTNLRKSISLVVMFSNAILAMVF